MNPYHASIPILTVLCILLFSSLCLAHKLRVFAYAEGKHIHCEAAFSRGKPAINCATTVLEASSGKVLRTGMTNKEGKFSFLISNIAHKNQEITVEVKCNDGHMNSWRLSSKEYLDSKVSREKHQQAHDIINDSPSIKDILIGLGIIFVVARLIKCFHLRRKAT